MIKSNSFSKPRDLLFITLAVIIVAGILLDPTGILALVGLGVGIGFVIGIITKG